MADTYVRFPSASSASVNPSVGPNLQPIPTSATLVAGENPSLELQPLQTDALGNLLVNVDAGTLTVLNPSVSTTGTPVPPDATYVGMDVAGNLVGLAGTVNGLKVDGSAVTQPVSAASLPLPTGAATSALQTTGNSTLSTISGQLPATLGAQVTAASVAVNIASDQIVPVSASALPLPTGAATSALQTTGNASLASIVTNTGGLPTSIGAHVTAASLAVNIASDQVVPVSATSLPLPTGAATSANQTNASQKTQIVDGAGNVIASTANALNVDVTNFPTSSPVNANGSSASTTVSTAANITKPANAVGFILQCDVASTDYIRWCDSNSTASTTNGFVLQPGQDTGFVPLAHTLSVCAHSGTQDYNVQWILSS